MGSEILRHGWGGNLHQRSLALQERKETELELDHHPFKEQKFGLGSSHGDLDILFFENQVE